MDASGTVVAHREYDAYGNTIVATGPMVNDFNFWFSTKYFDQETGLYYFGLRFYSPELGRWLSRDPMGELGALSLYGFLNNAPINSHDPVGLAEVANDTGGSLVIISSFDFNYKVNKAKCCSEDASDKVSAVPLPLASGVGTKGLEMGDVDAVIGPDGSPYKTGGTQEIKVGAGTGDFSYTDIGGWFGSKGKKPISDFWIGGNIISRCDGAISQLNAVRAKAAECPDENKDVLKLIDRLLTDVGTAKQILQSKPYKIK